MCRKLPGNFPRRLENLSGYSGLPGSILARSKNFPEKQAYYNRSSGNFTGYLRYLSGRSENFHAVWESSHDDLETPPESSENSPVNSTNFQRCLEIFPGRSGKFSGRFKNLTGQSGKWLERLMNLEVVQKTSKEADARCSATTPRRLEHFTSLDVQESSKDVQRAFQKISHKVQETSQEVNKT